MERILKIFKLVYLGDLDKGVTEFEGYTVTLYRVGSIVRIDVKGKE